MYVPPVQQDFVPHTYVKIIRRYVAPVSTVGLCMVESEDILDRIKIRAGNWLIVHQPVKTKTGDTIGSVNWNPANRNRLSNLWAICGCPFE